MDKIVRIVVETGSQYVGAIIAALTDAGVPANFSVGGETTLNAPTTEPTWNRSTANGREVTQAITRKRRDAGQPRGARTVYVPGRNMTVDRVKKLDTLSDTQKEVAVFILRNAGKVGMRDTQDHFAGKINPHTVDGSINTLRKHTPAVIVSQKA